MFVKLFKIIGVLCVAAIAIAAVLVAGSAVARSRPRMLPVPTGPAAVGRIEFALRDSGRVDPLAADGRARELAVWIWYPTSDRSTHARAPYLPATWSAALDKTNGLLGVFFQNDAAIRTDAVAGAPLQGTPPVVVLLPGLGRAVADYSALAEDLASHGYAVVGVNVTESSMVEFPDGHMVLETPRGTVHEKTIDAWYPAAERLTNVWADDAAFVVARLEASPPPIGPLDFDHVAYLGHSMGGAAAFELGRRDPRCAAVIDLDGTLWTEVRHTGPKAPGLLLMAAVPAGKCDVWCERSRVDRTHVMAVAPVRELDLEGARHFNFSDVGLMFGPLLRPANALGPIAGARAIDVTRDVVRAFLDQHVRGAPSAELDRITARYPELRAIASRNAAP